MRSPCQFIINDGSQKFYLADTGKALSFIHRFTSRSDFLTDLKTMKHDFSTFKDNSFTCDHMETSFNSELSCVSIAFRPLPLINMLVSSANIIVNKISEILGKSFTYDKNNKGPNIDPWGTPHVMDRISVELSWFIHDILLSIYHIAFYPVQYNSSDTIVI